MSTRAPLGAASHDEADSEPLHEAPQLPRRRGPLLQVDEVGLCPSLSKEAQCFASIGAVPDAEDLNFQKKPLDRTILGPSQGHPGG